MSEDLILKLAKEGVKKPLASLNLSCLLSCLALFFYFVTLLLIFGIRSDFLSKISEINFQIELLLCLASSIAACASINFLRLPDLSQKKLANYSFILFFLIFLFLVFSKIFIPSSEAPEAFCNSFNYQCALGIVVFSLIPLAFLLIILRRGIVTNFIFSALAAGIGSGSLSYLATRLIHESGTSAHLFIWHFLPIFLVIFLAIILTKLFTKKL